ncbi:MAG: type I methionyl aminopeptidase [Deltaproteobacteria bacterium]|nr:type I methionyl aminopeptidase [Deltaproteobacteria bacterium]
MGLEVKIKPRDLPDMRKACRLAADTLEMISEYIRPGITTDEINTIVHEYTTKHKARPAPLNYGATRHRKGFPKSVCTSVNEVVCHGIPGPYLLKDGDIINVDVTSVFPAKKGYYGDTSATFYVGTPSAIAIHVVEVCREALEIGIAQVRPGNRTGDIGFAIQRFVESKGCSIVREYTGHGIGRVFHGPPSITHYGVPGRGAILRPGMTFTIEPMINLIGPEIEHLDDEWTVVTRDGSLSAQFEHTITVTKTGCEVLTARERTLKNSEDRQYSKVFPLSCYMPK